MHWGHATSPDLVHWTQQPIAIYPHKYGDWAFSGSAIIDRDASTGFQTGEEPIIVAAYTSTARGESLAWSRDAGVTWKDYVGNPVVKHKGRDPRLLYHAPSRRWIMAVYDEFEGKRCIAFYSAPDLRLWTFESRIEGFYECPDLYELPIDGDPAKTRWVLSGADGAYLLGQFDGHAFTPDSPQKQPNNFGNCFYAAQTFSDIPPSDGRRIQMAWGRVKLPGAFNQQMLFPTELTLRTTPAGLRLCTNPVREIEKLHGTSHDRLDDLHADLLHLKLELAVAPASQITLTLRGVPVVYDAAKAQLTCGKSTGPLKPIDGRIQLELLLDRATIELFGNGGELYMPLAITPALDRHDHALRLSPDASVIKCQAWELNRAWK
jgi:fructan beta-fructosidase